MCKRTPIKKVESYICKCVYELDENKRFVYSQAFYNANWLKSLANGPRDKSRKEVDCGTHLRNLGFLDWSHKYDDVRASDSFNRSIDLWEIQKPSYELISETHQRAGSGPEIGLSDLEIFNRKFKEYAFYSDTESDT